MQSFRIIKASAFAALALFTFSCEQDESLTSPVAPQLEVAQEIAPVVSYESNVIPGQYIVVLKESGKSFTDNRSYDKAQNAMRTVANIKLAAVAGAPTNVKEVYSSALAGFTAKLDAIQLERLRRDKDVDYIEEDQFVILKKPSNPGGGGGDPVAQQTPYGTTRVNGGVDGSNAGTAWIIDSGIDLDHPDLNVDQGRSRFFVGRDANDQNGHGTHVAGTVAAIDNSIGSLGVAAGATVVAVRVLDRRGSGSISGVIGGVDYVGGAAASGDVANMSLGGGVSTALDDAVVAASSACPFVLAAGNESDDANNHSPARANGPNVYTISAMNSSDNWASFSNYGAGVDYCAPGVGIYSTWKSGGYNTISGTSMAAPHAAGVILLGNFGTDGTVNGDPDGNADAIIVH